MNNINNKNRHERKFVFNGNKKLNLFIALVKSNFFFRNHHPSRQVNSIYFDTNNLKNIHDNLDGISNRKKIRIRWYGSVEKLHKPVLEYKIKSNFNSFKENYNLQKFGGINISNTKKMASLYNYVNKNFSPRERLVPVCLVRYKRTYLISSNSLIRATIDDDIKYKRFLNFKQEFFRESFNTVLELKYDTKLDKYVRDNINFLQSRISKNSKYINGTMLTTNSVL